eukprot:254909_1
MNCESTLSTKNLKQPKLTRKKSFKEKLFGSNDRGSQPRLKLKDSQSCGTPVRKKRSKSLKISTNLNSPTRTRQSSRLVNFIQGTFEKLTQSPIARTSSDPNLNIDPHNIIVIDDTSTSLKMTQRSQWKPSLNTISSDSRLLPALITFMERSYNEESILFLQSVRQLNSQLRQPHRNEMDIDYAIRSIFLRYIAASAEYQINLSYACSQKTTKMCETQSLSTYSMDQKRNIFDAAVAEVNRLMVNSVLGLFYDSREFQSIAQLSNSSSLSETSLPVPPPIVLSMSQSALSLDVAMAFESPSMVQEKDVFSKNEMVFMSDGYFNVLSTEAASSPTSPSSV